MTISRLINAALSRPMSWQVARFGINMMKIAYFVRELGRVSETFVSDLIEGVASQGIEVHVICNSITPSFQIPHEVTVHQRQYLNLNRVLDRIASRLNRQMMSVLLAKNTERQLKPILQEIACDVGFVDFGNLAVQVRPLLDRLQLPFVVHLHGADVTSSLNDHRYRDELHRVFDSCCQLIVASNHIRRLAVLEGAAAEKVRVIRLGVDVAGRTPLPMSQRTANPSIVFLGRLTAKKHPVALIEAFRLVKQRIADATLTIIGDGPERSEVEQRISQYKLDKAVKLLGELHHDQAMTEMRKHWVYAQHSVTSSRGDQEGFGISLAEAASLELPVVSTHHNGIPEQVIHGETGFLCPEHNFEEMAAYLCDLLSEPAKIIAMGRKGRDCITAEFSPTDRFAEVSALLKGIAKRRRLRKQITGH